jgi:hypothetical protein
MLYKLTVLTVCNVWLNMEYSKLVFLTLNGYENYYLFHSVCVRNCGHAQIPKLTQQF